MNIEQAFIKNEKNEEIIEYVKSRLDAMPEIGTHIDMELPNSYDSIIAKDTKRKVAVSDSVNGWVSILESKEVNDYKMLLEISKILYTKVICLVCSDVIGACGFAEFQNGNILKNCYYEDKDDVERFLEDILHNENINIPLSMFREVASKKISGWTIYNI